MAPATFDILTHYAACATGAAITTDSGSIVIVKRFARDITAYRGHHFVRKEVATYTVECEKFRSYGSNLDALVAQITHRFGHIERVECGAQVSGLLVDRLPRTVQSGLTQTVNEDAVTHASRVRAEVDA